MSDRTELGIEEVLREAQGMLGERDMELVKSRALIANLTAKIAELEKNSGTGPEDR